MASERRPSDKSSERTSVPEHGGARESAVNTGNVAGQSRAQWQKGRTQVTVDHPGQSQECEL